MAEEKEQTVSGTGVSWPGPATEQSDSGTGVLSPGPSLRQKHLKGSTRDSWNNSWDKYDYRDKWTGVWKSDHDGNRWIHGWNEHYHNDDWMDAWRKRNPGDEWRTSHWEKSSWCSSRWETSGGNEASKYSNDHEGFFLRYNERGPVGSTSFVEAMITLPLSRGLRSIQVSHWLTQHRVESLTFVRFGRPKRLFHKFGLKPRVIPGDNQALGIAGKAKVLGKVEMPSGMGGVNGKVKYTVVDWSPASDASVSAQTSWCRDRFNNNTMDLKKIETTTTLRALPSGHVAHKLTEFALGGWKAPTPEQTELFQVRTDVFYSVNLPGEIKSRSSKQCAGFSSGFVYTVRDRSHLSPSHHQDDPDLCVDDTTSSDLFSDDQVAQGTSGFECSFASGFDVNANSAMGKLCTGRRGSVEKTCSAVPGSRHPSVVANRAGLKASSFLKNRSDRVYSFAGTPGPSQQPVGFDGCVR